MPVRMNRRRLFLAAMACLLLLGCGEDQPALDGPETIADTILSNGRIYTVDPAQAWVEAVAIREGKYIYVGDSAGLVLGLVCVRHHLRSLLFQCGNVRNIRCGDLGSVDI